LTCIVILEEVTNGFSKGGSSGLAGLHNRLTHSFKPSFERSDLGGLATAFTAFECDE
jgi:hypothetical protein